MECTYSIFLYPHPCLSLSLSSPTHPLCVLFPLTSSSLPFLLDLTEQICPQCTHNEDVLWQVAIDFPAYDLFFIFLKKYPLPLSHLLRCCIMNSRQIRIDQIDLLQLRREITKRLHDYQPGCSSSPCFHHSQTGKHKYPRQELELTVGKASSYFLFRHDHLYRVCFAKDYSRALLCPPLGLRDET